ncbi:hypothetical protein FH972_005266 [Carpinus fangiana]|uniref:Uncharacterized protein n=1 Tax=Carpinus fangiana TaxID=176857 RepID=A0A5N6QR54_9ROSI|nr:hypothetical protein FH972_005266 [Carpinus fangiana]
MSGMTACQHSPDDSRSFSTDLGDFIPLDSPDDSELADAEAPFSLVGCFGNNQAGWATFECDENLCFPKPYVIRPISSDETSKLENFYHPFAASSSDMDSCCGIAEPSSAVGSLFNLGDSRLKDSANHLRLLQSTGCQEQSGLYHEDEIPSSKDSVQEKVDDTRVDKSVDDIMEELLQRQDKLRKMVKQAESFEHENEYCHKKKRTSVFSRLTR